MEGLMDYPDFSLDGKVAMITGASKGIGYGLSKAIANAGADVALVARSGGALEKLAEEIRPMGREALVLPVDIRQIDDIQNVVDRVCEHFGELDILVNNAGLGDNQPALEVSENDWDEMMSVNLKGLFFCSQAAGRVMLEAGSGRIINMSSQASIVGIRDHAVYCATKGGVDALTRVLALEWSAHGVTVNSVAPTFIYTPGTAERLDQPEYLNSVLDRLPIKRVGTITDVASAVIYLASPAGGMVTGTTLLVDGGWTSQ